MSTDDKPHPPATNPDTGVLIDPDAKATDDAISSKEEVEEAKRTMAERSDQGAEGQDTRSDK